MDDPNITMEEYIQLMADKARGRDQTFNWETATYGKVYCEDLDSFTDFETDFPAIVYNDASTSNQNVSSEPTVSIYNAIKSDIDFHISFSDSEDEDYTFIYNKDSSSYKLIPANDLKPEPVNDYVEINIESCSENIDVKPMDSVICISKDTTPVEFDENFETNHDIHQTDDHSTDFGPRIQTNIKDFLKLVDSLDLDGDNRERTRLRLFQFSLYDQASNWLERLLAGSITTWDDLTTRFLAQLFPPGRTAKLCNDILMFQQHHGESLSEAWTHFKGLLQKVPHHGIDLWLQVQIFYDHVNPVTRRAID
ncbi:zinc finger, CCHC-type containing protein [Tanacetum coccineum]